MKGLIINQDVWDLIDDLDAKETKNLTACLAALHRGEPIPTMSRMVKGVFNRIALDNGRFNNDISEIRRQAALKRWHRDEDIQNDAKVYANDAKMQIAQEEKRKEEKRIDKDISPTIVSPKAKSALFENEEVCAAWREYEEMRKKIKKPLLGQAESRAISKLESLSNGNPDMAVKVLNQSTDHCWVGLFEVKPDWKWKQNTSRNPRGEDYDKVAWDMFAKSAKEDKKVSYAAATTELFVRDLKGG